MVRPPLDVTQARILISNDDGIQSVGIKVLERIARSLTQDVWVCAPEIEQSGAGHSLTLHRPLRVKKYDAHHVSVDGTPTDCVMFAVNHLMRDRKPDLVLSGINHGANIGDDVTYSGTVAAAMEASLLGTRAIALSQCTDEATPLSFAVAERMGSSIIRRLAAASWPSDILVNVNFPVVPDDVVPPVHVVRHGRRKLGDDLRERFDPRGRAYYWIGPQRTGDPPPPDTDLAVVENGGISVTPLGLDLTHWSSMPGFAESLGEA